MTDLLRQCSLCHLPADDGDLRVKAGRFVHAGPCPDWSTEVEAARRDLDRVTLDAVSHLLECRAVATRDGTTWKHLARLRGAREDLADLTRLADGGDTAP